MLFYLVFKLRRLTRRSTDICQALLRAVDEPAAAAAAGAAAQPAAAAAVHRRRHLPLRVLRRCSRALPLLLPPLRGGQGLTLVYFSAQPDPFPTQNEL
jgi:hypothetical protein